MTHEDDLRNVAEAVFRVPRTEPPVPEYERQARVLREKNARLKVLRATVDSKPYQNYRLTAAARCV
jgi:hypothetical protein